MPGVREGVGAPTLSSAVLSPGPASALRGSWRSQGKGWDGELGHVRRVAPSQGQPHPYDLCWGCTELSALWGRKAQGRGGGSGIGGCLGPTTSLELNSRR